MAGKSKRKKTNRDSLAIRQIEQRTATKRRGRRPLSEDMKSRMESVKDDFLYHAILFNLLTSEDEIEWKDIQKLLRHFGCNERSSRRAHILNVFKKKGVHKSHPSKEMVRVMSLAISGLPHNKRQFVLNRLPTEDNSKRDFGNQIAMAASAKTQQSLASWCQKFKKPSKVHYPFALLVHLSMVAMQNEEESSVDEVVEDEFFRILNHAGCKSLAKIPEGYHIPDVVDRVKSMIAGFSTEKNPEIGSSTVSTAEASSSYSRPEDSNFHCESEVAFEIDHSLSDASDIMPVESSTHQSSCQLVSSDDD